MGTLVNGYFLIAAIWQKKAPIFWWRHTLFWLVLLKKLYKKVTKIRRAEKKNWTILL